METDNKGMNRLTGKSNVTNGYCSHNFSENHFQMNDQTKWRFDHKPYQTDYKSELLKK